MKLLLLEFWRWIIYSNTAWFILLLPFITGVGGLRNVTIRVPLAVTAGATVSLFCSYDLENEPLYTIKWYKGRQEFFRYVPKELPHTRVFPIKGFNVDVSLSGPERVVLRDVNRAMSGRYLCEVSTDAPDFLTMVVAANMNIVRPLDQKPLLEVDKTKYSLGETLRGNCTSPPSSPPANLTLYVNGNKVRPGPFMKSHFFGEEDHKVTITEVSLEVNSFLGSRVRLQCVADLFGVFTSYSEVIEVVVVEDKPILASVLDNRENRGQTSRSFVLLVSTLGALASLLR
ncbi:uncharacterized protein LOC129001788 [Macrosteles quadrilineatus]|uniref:uncharacterized protein LOC129001788 n=1 Tax=Macrosteles quadrilineatus TaxID=74068 RepID=UPI0023E1C935|nr:uncharacterized protein LOC129001788 [Macrosteles quadrilineatus]